jgi:MFS family permease
MSTNELAKPSPAHTTESGEDQARIGSGTVEPFQVIEPSGQDETEYPTGVKFAAVMIAMGLSLILVGLDNTILATAIPSITNHFKTITDIGWYASAYRLISSSLQFMFGKFYSLFPVRVVFLVALAIFETGSLLAACAPTSRALVVGRAISGVGSAGIIQGIFTMITQTVPLRRRSMYGGLGAGIETVASISAPLLGGVLTDNLSWRWCFWINLPLGAITLVVVGFLFENPRVNPNLSLPLKAKLEKLDLLGTAIFVPSITALLLALQWGGSTYSWANARIIILLVLFAALIGIFVWLQYRKGDRATLPPRIIMQRSILCGAWFSFCTNASLSVVDYYVSTRFFPDLNHTYSSHLRCRSISKLSKKSPRRSQES